MNTKNTKKLVSRNKLTAFFVACLMLVAVFVGLTQIKKDLPTTELWTAGAEMTEVPETDFWLEDGASVRYGTVNGKKVSGLRYTFQIKKSVYDAHNDYTKYGILIAPATYDLTPANVFGASAIYDWAVKNATTGEWDYTNVGKTRIANLPAEKFEDDTLAGVAIKQFYGSLIDLKDTNIAKEFRGVAYVGTSTDGVNYTYEFVTNESNVRSMAYVAQLAKADPESSADLKSDMDALYLSKVSTVVSSYTTEYYFEQADGSYAINAAETTNTDSTINATVSPVQKTFDHYVVNTEKTDGATVVYANDKTVLKVYYSLASYTVTYDLGELKEDEYVEISAASSTGKYSASIALLTPTCDGYVFVGWQNAQGEFVGETFTVSGDETLTAVWEKDESADRWGPWSPVV